MSEQEYKQETQETPGQEEQEGPRDDFHIVPQALIDSILQTYNITIDNLSPACKSYITSLYKITRWKPNNLLISEFYKSHDLDKIASFGSKLKDLNTQKNNKIETINCVTDQLNRNTEGLSYENMYKHNIIQMNLELSSLELEIKNISVQMKHASNPDTKTHLDMYEKYIKECNKFIEINNIYDFTPQDIMTTVDLSKKMNVIKKLIDTEIRTSIRRLSLLQLESCKQLTNDEYNPEQIIALLQNTETMKIRDATLPLPLFLHAVDTRIKEDEVLTANTIHENL
jgi:hypothetical protein